MTSSLDTYLYPQLYRDLEKVFSAQGYTVEAYASGNRVMEERAILETVKRAEGVYVASFSDAEADEMRTPFDIVALVNGVETGTPLTWSVEGYVKASRQNPNYSETDLNLLNALLHYVDAVAAVDAAGQN